MANVLILEDDDALRRMLAYVLEEEGHLVTEGDSGLIVRDPDVLENIDVLITDIHMPQGDGLGAVLFAKKARPDLKIITMSGGGDVDKRDYLPSSLHLGASRFLRKPFEFEEMAGCVREVLTLEHARLHADDGDPRKID